MPAADGRTLERDLSIPRPRGEAAGPGAIVDFQSVTSGHPPGALPTLLRNVRDKFCAPRRRHVAVFGTTERPCRPRFLTALQQPSFYACCNAKRQPPGCPLKCGSGKAGFCKSGAVVSCAASPRHRHKKFGLPFAP